MRIWVDADACPGVIKDIIVRAAEKRHIETIFVANKPIALMASQYISAVQVGMGADVADAYIAEHVSATDLVISQDIPLAGQLVPLGITVISPYGTLFTLANIGERLSVRNFLTDLRSAGGSTGGPKPLGDKEKRQFANAFDQALVKLTK